jgi:signal transduction histidine kinase
LQFSIYIYIIFASGKIFTFLPFLPAENYSFLNYEFINFRVLLTILLIYAFMKDYIVDHTYRYLTMSIIGVTVLNFFLIGFGFVQMGIYTYVAVIALNMPIQFYGLHKASNMPTSIFWLLKLSFLVMTTLIVYGYINIFTDNETLTSRGAEFIFYTNYRLNGAAFGVVVFLILIIKYYEKTIQSLIRDKDLQLAQETSRMNNEKLQERQTLIDVLTHEIKNPLSTLKFAAYSLKQSVTTEDEIAERTNRINGSLLRIDQLISHVANSNKIDLYQIESKFDQVHAKSLVTQIIEDQITHPLNIEEKFHIDINPTVIFCSNLQMLSLIIENLISNALKYSSPHTQIVIKIDETETHHIFSISNHFPLQAKPDADKLFQRYYRHDVFQPMPGMGLGLTLVKDAAQKSGSEVDFQLENERITFTLSVPVCDA